MATSFPKATDGAILLSMSAGGSENDQVYLLDRANFRTTLLTDGKSRNRIDAVRDDGKQMIIGSNQRNGRDTDLYLADPRKPGSMQMLMEVSGEFWSAADWSQDGKRLLLLRYVSTNESYPAMLRLGKRQADRPAAARRRRRRRSAPWRSRPTASRRCIATDAGGEFRSLARLDLATPQVRLAHAATSPWDVSGLEVDRSQRPRRLHRQCRRREPALFARTRQRRQAAAPRATHSAHAASSPRSSSRPTANNSASRSPGPTRRPTPIRSTSATGKLTRWTYSEVGGLNPATFITAEPIRFHVVRRPRDSRLVLSSRGRPRPSRKRPC